MEILRIFVFAVGISAAAVVVGLSDDKIVAAMTSQPVAIVVWVGIACLLTGLLLSWTLQSSAWLERAVIAFSLLVALSGGIYLTGAVHVSSRSILRGVPKPSETFRFLQRRTRHDR